jgi:hypothetical protein
LKAKKNFKKYTAKDIKPIKELVDKLAYVLREFPGTKAHLCTEIEAMPLISKYIEKIGLKDQIILNDISDEERLAQTLNITKGENQTLTRVTLPKE